MRKLFITDLVSELPETVNSWAVLLLSRLFIRFNQHDLQLLVHSFDPVVVCGIITRYK